MEKLDLNISSVDLEKAESGAWVPYEEGISFKIARANTPAYRGAVRRMHRQHKRQIDQESLSDAQSDNIMADLMSSYLLLDWKGLVNGGEEFPYTKENAELLLKAEKYSELRNWIVAQANDLENFRSETIKKPKKPS